MEKLIAALKERTLPGSETRWYDVLSAACKYEGALLLEVLEQLRRQECVRARDRAFDELHSHWEQSYTTIASMLGYHHTSVMEGVRRHRARSAGLVRVTKAEIKDFTDRQVRARSSCVSEVD